MTTGANFNFGRLSMETRSIPFMSLVKESYLLLHLSPRRLHGCFVIFTIFLLFSASFKALAEDHDVSLEEDPGTWVLFFIEANPDSEKLERLGQFDSMLECFDAWTKVEDRLPKPKINFQIICIRTIDGYAPMVPL